MDWSELSYEEAEAERAWQVVRARRAEAARHLRRRRVLPTREAIDRFLTQLRTTWADRRSAW